MNVNITHSFGTKICSDILSKNEIMCSTMKEEKEKQGL